MIRVKSLTRRPRASSTRCCKVLDEGRMTDGQGPTEDFKNTVVVMTSNLGLLMILQMAGDDHRSITRTIMGDSMGTFALDSTAARSSTISPGSGSRKNLGGIQLFSGSPPPDSANGDEGHLGREVESLTILQSLNRPAA